MKTVFLLAMLVPTVAFAAATNDDNVSAISWLTGITASADVNGEVSLGGSEATMSPRFCRSGTPGDPCAALSTGDFQYKTVDVTSDGSGPLSGDFDPGT